MLPDLSMTAPLAWRPISPLSRDICCHRYNIRSLFSSNEPQTSKESPVTRQTDLSSCAMYHYRTGR